MKVENKKIIILQNQITPYRSIVFNELAKTFKDKLIIYYCNQVETNRMWKINDLHHKHIFLKKVIIKFGHNHIYFNFDVLRKLKLNKPDIVVTYGFNPVMLFSCLYAIINGKKHFVLTDSWLFTVNKLTYFHRLIRRIVFKFTDRFICIGEKSKEYLQKYKVNNKAIYVSPLVVDNDYYKQFVNEEKKYDIIFSGRFIKLKNPFFIIDILIQLKKKHPNISILLLGDGDLKNEMLHQLKESNIYFHYPGFLQQEELPKNYASGKILLFPSKEETWGLVVNEACAVGVPVITCDNTGVAHDLIIDNYNGYVIPLNVEEWVKKVDLLLNDNNLYKTFSKNALKSINKFTIEIAAKGIIDAVNSV